MYRLLKVTPIVDRGDLWDICGVYVCLCGERETFKSENKKYAGYHFAKFVFSDILLQVF